jgi:hypothetical protein
VTTAAIQRQLDRLPDVAHSDRGGAKATLSRRHLEALLCAARLNEAIDRADRWYAQREDDLRRFDHRATATVRQLVIDARVRPSLAWSSP